MNLIWLLIICNFIVFDGINADTYHYRVLRKICPTGTYHDPIRDKCRHVPGGGEVIKFNLEARCTNGFTGLLKSDQNSRYYFVCKSDAVLTCACKPKETFNRIRLRCEGKNKSSSVIRERYTDTVVDNIMEKYKCTMMNGHYQNGECWMPTTEQYVTYPPTESENPNISQLRNLVNYLRILQTLAISNEESWEAPTTEPPREIYVRVEEPPTTTEIYEKVTVKTLPPDEIKPKPKSSKKAAEKELDEWKKIWGITEAPESSDEPAHSSFSINAKEEEEKENSVKAQKTEEIVKSSRTQTTTEAVTSTTNEPQTTTTTQPQTTTKEPQPQTTREPSTSSTGENFEELVEATTTEKFEEISQTTTENFEQIVEATTTERFEEISETTNENFEPLVEATTTENFEQPTEINETTTFENLEEFTEKSTIEPEKSVSEEPFDDLEEFGMTQKSFDSDDVTKRSTTLPPTTTVQSRLMDQKPISSRKAQKKPKIGDTDFDENTGDDDLENVYEYYYEDEPENVLYTKKAEKSQSRSMTEDAAPNNQHEKSRKAEGSNDDYDIFDYFDVAEPDLVLWTKTINKKTKEETVEHHIVFEDYDNVGNFEETTSTDTTLEVTTLTENTNNEPTEQSVQKDFTTESFESSTLGDQLTTTTESISTTSEHSTPSESSTLTALGGRSFDDESGSTSGIELTTFSTLEGRSFDDTPTTTTSDIESSTLGGRSFDELTPEVSSTTENIFETTPMDENSMRQSEITTLIPSESTTESDSSTMNVPEELNMMPSTTMKIDISTNLIDFERSENSKKSLENNQEKVFISSGNDFSTFEPQTTENSLSDSTTDLGNNQESTTTEISVGSKVDTTSNLPESTTLNEEIVSHHVTSTQYPFTSSTVNPLYWQDPEKKEDIEYYYVYEDYETDEAGNPIKNSEEDNNESHDGKESVKKRRDNSFEYYVESISASREQRKMKPDMDNYSN